MEMPLTLIVLSFLAAEEKDCTNWKNGVILNSSAPPSECSYESPSVQVEKLANSEVECTVAASKSIPS